jgi:hypothetical protein
MEIMLGVAYTYLSSMADQLRAVDYGLKPGKMKMLPFYTYSMESPARVLIERGLITVSQRQI